MKEFFSSIGEGIAKYYGIYSNFVHSIFPDQLGDLVVYILDIVVAVLIIKAIAKIAFGSRNGGYTSS